MTLHSITTATDPPFVFAYNPYDTDMQPLRRNLMVEPKLTRAWHEATWRCCSKPGGLVVDVGGNFGWYTLFSIALGCDVVVFEPVPAYQEVMRLGLSLNPGFASKATIMGNVVYHELGQYNVNMPIADADSGLVSAGMTGMRGEAGVLKRPGGRATQVRAAAVRIDDLIDRDVCMLKADVEGYEPQALQTAQRLVSAGRAPVLQFEVSRTIGMRNQSCAMLQLLEHIRDLGYDMRKLPGRLMHAALPEDQRTGWRAAPGQLRDWHSFPRRCTGSCVTNRTDGACADRCDVVGAYLNEFSGYTMNIVALRRPDAPRPASIAPWPPTVCSAAMYARLKKTVWNKKKALPGHGKPAKARPRAQKQKKLVNES
jgi:FkbM family methyltransferase